MVAPNKIKLLEDINDNISYVNGLNILLAYAREPKNSEQFSEFLNELHKNTDMPPEDICYCINTVFNVASNINKKLIDAGLTAVLRNFSDKKK